MAAAAAALSSFLLTVLDHSTHWPEAFLLVGITSEVCAWTFTSGWVAWFACPQISHQIMDVNSRPHCGITWIHPLEQRFTGQLRVILNPSNSSSSDFIALSVLLRACLSGNDWVDDLPSVLLSLHITPKENLMHYASTLILHHLPMLPGTLVSPPTPADVSFQQLPRHDCALSSSSSLLLPQLASASHVFMLTDLHHLQLDPPYQGSFHIHQWGDKISILEILSKEESLTGLL